MTPATPSSPPPASPVWGKAARALLAAATFLAAGVIFGVAYNQSVLYEGNQNTKFLHGLADSGGFYRLLQEDWLANTADPLPVFSLLVNLTARVNENLFYVYYLLLFGVYVISLVGILSEYFKERWNWGKSLAVFIILLLVHSRWAVNLMQRGYKVDLTLLQYGVAGQYLLGDEFQNSTFGVLVLLSIYLFMRRRYVWSLLSLTVACLLHSAYLFSAAWMVMAYLLVILVENYRGQGGTGFNRLWSAARQPFLLGLMTLALAIPLVWYNQAYLPAASPEISQQALGILVNLRIPHHALPEVWLHKYAYFQIGLMLLGVLLAFKNRLFAVMAFLFGGGALFTLVQMLTGDLDLALLGPWRVSTLLVPLGLALLVGWVVRLFFDLPLISKLPYAWLLLALALYVSWFTVKKGWDIQQMNNTGFKVRRIEQVMDYVRDTKQPGDVVLVPPKELEFDDFRLYTGVPIFINWKSHPYRDVEVLEWYQRVGRADDFYDAAPPRKCALLGGLLADYRITHVVIKGKEAALNCPTVQETFRSEKYAVYRVQP